VKGDSEARSPADYPSPRALLDKYGLRAKKSWGQNFLGDGEVLDHIARLAVEAPGERVVEIGAGLGHLTARLLARGAVVVAVERERDMVAVLRGELAGRVRVLEADAVRLDYRRLSESCFGSPGGAARGSGARPAQSRSTEARLDVPPAVPGERPGSRGAAKGESQAGDGGALVVVGNLPYHLTSPILFALLDQADAVRRAVLLVQREVAERLVASAGSKEWGLPSVLLQQRAEVSLERRVGAGAFLPRPRVESAVVRIGFGQPRGRQPNDPTRFRSLVKAGFAQRRKVLANALSAGRVAAPDAIAAALAAAGIDGRRRGETLTVEEWIDLERALAGSTGLPPNT
jgi:16S rRNA (adenine1518-N6/adenine1519-N6)-dimethyltransferase